MTLASASPRSAARPVIGVLCCNEVAERPVQVVASRFVEPLARIAGATVLLVPALAEVSDAAALTAVLDGLLLTGSRSNVGTCHYGDADDDDDATDPQRDLVALRLAERMIEAGRPVFGICRGLQELNVLFGGTLTRALPGDAHHRAGDLPFEALFDHRHDVALSDGGVLRGFGAARASVNSVHRQGIDLLGAGLRVEAVSPEDGLVEGFSARPCGGDVLAVQWHPEWNGAQGPVDHGFFRQIGTSLRSARQDEDRPAPPPGRGH